jgi:hypothetical protein
MHDPVAARSALTGRIVEVAVIVGAAALAAVAIALWHSLPWPLSATCGAILAALLVRYREPRDLVGLAVGATVGNAIELACDAAGVWQHADRSVLNLAPAYILLCYPILGLAMPRMVDALIGASRSRRELIGSVAPISAGLLLMFVLLSMQFGRDASAQLLVCTVCLALTLWRFHSRHDLITAFAGAVIALAWEVPATIAGAWQFPHPQVLGLLPVWLPAAYAVFFVTMGRLTGALAEQAAPARPFPGQATPPQARIPRTPGRATVAFPTLQTPDTSRFPVERAVLRTRSQSRRPPTGLAETDGTARFQARRPQAQSGER